MTQRPLAPVVDLARIRRIRTIEIMERDLDTLDRIVTTENAALGFFTGTAGAFAGAALGWLGASGLSPVRHALFGVVTLTTAILALWFLVQWRIARAQRPSLLAELRSHAEDRALLDANR
jgi:hypothetical protein